MANAAAQWGFFAVRMQLNVLMQVGSKEAVEKILGDDEYVIQLH